MINFIIGLIGFLIVGLGVFFVTRLNQKIERENREALRYARGTEKVEQKKRKSVLIPIIAGILVIIISGTFVIIPTGYTGVKRIFGQVNEIPASNGFNFKIPFVENIELVNNKQQDITFEDKIWGEAKEKTVTFAENVVVTYKINPEKSAWICANVTNYKDNLVSTGVVSSAIKSAMVELETDNVTNRSYLEPLAKEKIQKAIDEKYGENVVEIVKVVVNNADFEDSYNAAIAEKQIARQEKERAEIENQTKIQNATAEAEAKKIKAQGEADAKLIEAQAEAEANRLKEESLTDKIMKNKYIEKWDGALPKVASGNTGLMYDVSENVD